MPLTDVKVKLFGEDGNAFAILGRVSRALRRGGHPELVKEFTDEATSGDYNHLLATCMEYIIEDGSEGEDDWEDCRVAGPFFDEDKEEKDRDGYFYDDDDDDDDDDDFEDIGGIK